MFRVDKNNSECLTLILKINKKSMWIGAAKFNLLININNERETLNISVFLCGRFPSATRVGREKCLF